MVSPLMEVKMKGHRLVAVAVAVAAVASLAAAPSGYAGEVPYDFTVCTHSRYLPVEANAEIVTFGVENWGVVSSSTSPLWNSATTHCVGYLRLAGGKPIGKGTCQWTVVGGDTAVGEWEYPPAGMPTWTWLSGTGKLKGITGGGSFQDVVSAKPGTPGIGAGCRRDWGKAYLP